MAPKKRRQADSAQHIALPFSAPEAIARAGRAIRRAELKEQMAATKAKSDEIFDILKRDQCQKAPSELQEVVMTPWERVRDSSLFAQRAWDSQASVEGIEQAEYDPDFGKKVSEQYKLQEEKDNARQAICRGYQEWREQVYGIEVAREFSSGNTPTHLRDARLKRSQAELRWWTEGGRRPSPPPVSESVRADIVRRNTEWNRMNERAAAHYRETMAKLGLRC